MNQQHQPTSTGSAILTEGLTRRFGDFTAVDRLDLEVHAGEIYGLLGPNGAGKSTTVRMLCTLTAPTSGRASIVGHDVVADADLVRRRIGVALQEAALDPKQTGRQLLTLQGRLYGMSRRTAAQRADELIGLVDIGDAIDRQVESYSGGMRRRLDLAVALVNRPEVLFLDEPTTGLDPVSRAAVWDEVERMNRELGMTILLTTQYLEEADALAHRVGIVTEGKLVAEGTPHELKRRIGRDVIIATIDHAAIDRVNEVLASVDGADEVSADGDDVFITTDSGPATIGPVAVALANAQIEVTNLTLRTPTLDDVFLDVTGARFEHSTTSEHEEVAA